MAVLKIYDPIGTNQGEFSLSDFDSFIQSMPSDDKEITIRMSCIGGDVDQGIAIYNTEKLLQDRGFNITCKIEGNCDSIATIIALGAQNRIAYPSITPLVHHPWVKPDGSPINVDDAKELYEAMQMYTNKLKDIYKAELNISDEEISQMMSDDKPISNGKAKEIGLFTQILQPVKAMSIINLKTDNMDQKSLVKEIVEGVTAIFAKKETPKNMSLKDKDGVEFMIEKEDGEVAIGDVASPDGSYTMEDGTIIVITDGKVSDIKTAEAQAAEKAAAEAEALKATEANKVAELENKLAELEKANAELTEKVSAQVAEVEKAKAAKTTFKVQARDKAGVSPTGKESYIQKKRKELGLK